MVIKDSLNISDIALLKVIADHPNCTRAELWQSKGRGLWNKFLRSSGLIHLGRCSVVTREGRFSDALATLKFCGYLRLDTPHCCISDVGGSLFFTLSPRPALWPLILPLNERGERLWDEAIYFTAK